MEEQKRAHLVRTFVERRQRYSVMTETVLCQPFPQSWQLRLLRRADYADWGDLRDLGVYVPEPAAETV